METGTLTYVHFLRNLFVLGLHQKIEDPILLSLKTEELFQEAEAYASFLLHHPEIVSVLPLFSWEDIQKEIRKEKPSFSAPSLDPFSGLFSEYLRRKGEN